MRKLGHGIGQYEAISVNGQWTDSTTNMTSFQILGAQSDSLGVGSYLRLVGLGD